MIIYILYVISNLRDGSIRVDYAPSTESPPYDPTYEFSTVVELCKTRTEAIEKSHLYIDRYATRIKEIKDELKTN